MSHVEQRLPVVDGLRAVAVVAVVLFHGFPALVGGGYVGVDIFFVISGFVIALRYLAPMVAREVGYPTFFLRRVRRLVPAYFAMLAATAAVALWLFAPRDLINFGYSLLGQALYAQNLVFWMQGEYFDAALLKPLLHTWSLAIEEQFYLLFPLLVVVARRAPRAAVGLCVLVALGGIAGGAYVEQISPKTTFYWLPFRCWEFLAGIGAALLFRRGVAERLGERTAGAVGVLALAALLVAILAFDEDNAGLLTQNMLAVVATVALCLVQRRLPGWCAAVFTNRAAQHAGTISYSWYLWHWPPLAFAFVLLHRPAAGMEAVALLVLGYVLGLASWRLLERGASRSAWLARPSRTVALLLAFLFFAAATGAALVASHGFVQRYPARVQPLLLAQMDRPDGRCALTDRLRYWKRQTCPITAVRGAGGILFLGDSHVEMQKHVLATLGDRYGVPVHITKQNCRLVDFGVDRNCGWKVWRGIARDFRVLGITRVVVIALWPDRPDAAALADGVGRLLATGVQVVIERPTPRAAALAPAYYLDRARPWGERSDYPRAEHDAAQRAFNDAASALAARDPRVAILDPVPPLCPGRACLFADRDRPLYSDTHHLTAAGMRLVAPVYAPLFAAARRDREAARLSAAAARAGPAGSP